VSSGETVGQISFDKLSDRWQTPSTDAYVVFYGLTGAVCDGPAAPRGNNAYAPGRCFANYWSVRYNDNVEPAKGPSITSSRTSAAPHGSYSIFNLSPPQF
jgi:hypothetical protein